MTLEEIKIRLDKAYGFNIALDSNEYKYSNAKMVFCKLADENYKDLADVAEMIGRSRSHIVNIKSKDHRLRNIDWIIYREVKREFEDKREFAILDGHKIHGKALTSLMIEMSSWEEHRVIEFIEENVKPFKTTNKL